MKQRAWPNTIRVAFGASTVKMEEDRSGNVSLPLDICVDPRAHVQSVHPRGNMTFAAHRNGRAIGCSINCESMQHGKGKESSRGRVDVGSNARQIWVFAQAVT